METIQDRGPDDAPEVITALAPVEAGLAEHPPGACGRHEVDAERAKEFLAGGGHFAAVVAQRDVPALRPARR